MLKTTIAANDQKRVNKGVTNGLEEMSELLDRIFYFRRRWQKAEEDQKAKDARKSKSNIETKMAQTPGAPKRAASSPLQREAEKKKKELSADGFQMVFSKAAKRAARKLTLEEKHHSRLEENDKPQATQQKPRAKLRRKTKAEALLVKPADGRSYSDVLREIKQAVRPEDTETAIKAVRQTRSGGILLEFGQDAANTDSFREAVKKVLGEKATVASLEPKGTLEIRDIDCVTEIKEVEEALRKEFPTVGEAQVRLTPENSKGQRVAIINLSEKDAECILEKGGKIKVGWVVCRIRRRATPSRCFKCLGFGHMAQNCRGPDRSSLCFRCGKPGHTFKRCQQEPHCILCENTEPKPTDLAHASGTGKCRVFREALAKAKAELQ